ncbi:hypothetical protein P167DRAFT_579359 [Morchella conica CCBAS932]|uniref:Uncharacterized protein n=1 Tax=Morchella conica CCBAS932 TaxID=1392247 RepID=A0A3N4KCY3_9PEZI|nr:hypothetical protein P167DRAFT_579359 [Morchella conica CCBAS932]
MRGAKDPNNVRQNVQYVEKKNGGKPAGDSRENPVVTGMDLGMAKAQEASTNAFGDALPGDK